MSEPVQHKKENGAHRKRCIPLLLDFNLLQKLKNRNGREIRVRIFCICCGKYLPIRISREKRSFYEWGEILFKGVFYSSSILKVLNRSSRIPNSSKNLIEFAQKIDFKTMFQDLIQIRGVKEGVNIKIEKLKVKVNEIEVLIAKTAFSFQNFLIKLQELIELEIKDLRNLFIQNKILKASFKESEYGLFIHKTNFCGRHHLSYVPRILSHELTTEIYRDLSSPKRRAPDWPPPHT